MDENRSQRSGSEGNQDRPPSIVEGATNYHPESMQNVDKEGNMSQYGWQLESGGRRDVEKTEERAGERTQESSDQSSRQVRSTESVIICGRVEDTPRGDSEWSCVAAEWETCGKDQNAGAQKRQQRGPKRDVGNR